MPLHKLDKWAHKPKRKVVLFLCTGDTCRGPMAAGYMRKLLEERGLKDIEVRSAGVMTATGLLSTSEAIQLLETVGVDLRRHRSTQLTPDLIRKADLILGMTPFHVQFALRMSEDAKDKTSLFKEFTGSDPKNYQITDPMGHTLEVYKRVFREIRQACEFLADMEVITGKPTKPKTRPVKRPATQQKKAARPASAAPAPAARSKTPPRTTATQSAGKAVASKTADTPRAKTPPKGHSPAPAKSRRAKG